MGIKVGTILQRKGEDVFTLRPDASVVEAARQLRERNVGALVVSEGGTDVAGIVSERDIVRRLADEGADVLDRTVAEIMTTDVTTCGRAQTADELMALMTQGRVRHIPVVEAGQMVGIVSIGDVVKSAIDDLEVKAEALTDYVTGNAY